MLEFRESRLDVEEMLADEKRAVQLMEKEAESLAKKDRILQGLLKTAEADIQEFQTEKQQKLNELDVVVTLRLHQIEYLSSRNTLPGNLSPALVFTNEGLSALKQRIKLLQQEKAGQRKQHKELRLHHVRLAKDKHTKDLKIVELESRARDIQLLKFGQEVDVQKLENLSVNKTAEELIVKLTAQEQARAKELREWDRQIGDLKLELTRVTKQNTRKLERLADLSQSKCNLEAALNHTQQSTSLEFPGPKKSELQERARLTQLVRLQVTEIENLRQEIAMLSHKGGHILPPAQTPRPPTMPQQVRSGTGRQQGGQ